MRILGLDTGTKTGWAVMEDGAILESDVEDFSKKRGESNGMMFLTFRAWLQRLFRGLKPDLVLYEQAHHRGGAATEICVNLTGRVQEICANYDIEYGTVHTGTLKKWATGSGKASKAEMKQKAAEYLRRPPKDDNEADAVILAAYAQEMYGRQDG